MTTRFDGESWIYESLEEWIDCTYETIRCDASGTVNSLIDIGGSVAAGAGVGAATAAITGGDPGTGALIGGATGGVGAGISDLAGGPSITGATGGGDLSTAPAAPASAVANDLGISTAGASGTSAAGLAAPSGVGGGGMTDLSQIDASGSFAPSGSGDTVAPSDTSVPFGSDQVPTQAITGAPRVPTDGGGIGTGGGTTVMNAISDPTAGNIMKALGANAGPLAAIGGIGYNATQNQNVPGTAQLKSQADTMAAQGTQLQSYLTSGTLPPGAQTAIDQALNAAAAKIRSDYAARGMTGSSAETQDLNSLQLQGKAQAFDMASKLLQTGVNESGLASQIYENLVGINTKQAASMGGAIGNLAAALAGTQRSPAVVVQPNG